MAFSQDDRPLKVNTPLGKDKLLLQAFRGEEALSRLFHYQLEVLAENQTEVSFDKLLGQSVTVQIQVPGGTRFFSGICNRLAQGGRDADLTRYNMEIVPQFWLLTRRVQCRIFQQETVPDILKKVLEGLDVAFEIRGDFPKRDYCVQYRESDFNFASRLMEQEGIYYFFRHSDGGHQLVLANTPESHPDVPGSATAIYEEIEGGNRADLRIHSWRKFQELRSGKVTLWDSYFELPQKHLEAEKVIQDSVTVGKVTHKLKVAGNDKLELYEYPGGYAEWFDGVSPGGGDNAAALGRLFEENQRIASIRMQEEAVRSLTIEGSSNCSQLTAGHKFTLERHFNADGAYLLTRVEHLASLPDYRSGEKGPLDYSNSFRCIPAALPFRPERVTQQPVIHGTQTAIVVGPPGETIFPDKYGRVKVQFHWDRNGQKNADSSCWVRVSQMWGGANWGSMAIPHVGQEVVVSFEEGDPDRPLIVGRVYNAECMPPLELPANKTKVVVARDHGGNEIIMEGKEGEQQIRIHSPKDNSQVILGNCITMNMDDHWFVNAGGNTYQKIVGMFDKTVNGDVLDFFGGAMHRTIIGITSLFVGGWKRESILGAETKLIRGAKREVIKGTVYKDHIGMEYKKESGNKREKAPNVLRMIKEARFAYKTARKKIDGDEMIRVAAEQATEAGKIYNKMDEFKATASNVYQIQCATMKQKLQEEIIKNSGDTKRQAASIIEKATGDIKAKGAEIKFN